MENQLKNLSKEKLSSLLAAPAMVSLLASSKDGVLDRKEKKDAIEMSHLRTFTSNIALRPYYKLVEQLFRTNLEELLNLYDPLADNINEMQTSLKSTYEVIDELDVEYATLLKESLASYASHVANIHPKFSDFIDFSLFKIE